MQRASPVTKILTESRTNYGIHCRNREPSAPRDAFSCYRVRGAERFAEVTSVANRMRTTARILLAAALGLVWAAAIAPAGTAQEQHAAQTGGVENNKMGPYRALAQLAYSAFEKGDNAKAAELAHILERVWDKSEDYGGDTALSKTNASLFKQIDAAMDGFINPLMDYAKKAPDKAKVKAAYDAYQQRLRLAD